MLRDTLLLQKREINRRLKERYVQRDYAITKLSPHLVNVIIGPRRAGKSFFAERLVQGLGSFGYANFDDEGLIGLKDYDQLVSSLEGIYRGPEYLLLDEIQNLPRWELLVERLRRNGYRLVITGSNARLLSSELATHLTGRHLQLSLFPFSFAEYLRTIGTELSDAEKASALHTYVETGGFPEPLLKDIDRSEYLKTLLRSVIYKDIVVRHRIRSPGGVEELSHYLLSNVAQEQSFRGLAKVTRLRSEHTVRKYLGFLRDTFLFFSLQRFSYKLKEQLRANRKFFCIDNGLIIAASFRFSPDRGKLYENLAAIELHKRQLNGELELYFWKGPQQEEVDFVIKKGLKVDSLVQVCFDVDNPKTKAREARALIKAAEELRCEKLIILTDNVEREEETSWFGRRGSISYVPLWKWLLAEKA